MRKFSLSFTLLICLFALLATFFAASMVSAADDKPGTSVSATPEAEKAAIDGAISFSTKVETRWHIQDVVVATIANPLKSKMGGSITLTIPGAKAITKKFSVSPGKTDSLKFEINPLWDGRSRLTGEAVVSVIGLSDKITRTIDLGTNRISAIPSCPLDRIMEFRIINPTGQKVKGKLKLFGVTGLKPAVTNSPFEADGQTVVGITLVEPSPKEFSLGYELIDGIGRTIFRSPVCKYKIIEDFSQVPDGSPLTGYRITEEVGSNLATVEGTKRETQYVAIKDIPVCRLRYNFGAAGDRFSINPISDIVVTEEPVEIGLWIYGDATGATANCRFVDSTGERFATAGTDISWRGWRYTTFQVEGNPKLPLKLETLFALDSGSKALRGACYLGPVMLVTRTKEELSAAQPVVKAKN